VEDQSELFGQRLPARMRIVSVCHSQPPFVSMYQYRPIGRGRGIRDPIKSNKHLLSSAA
jgi:hypothetical protein